MSIFTGLPKVDSCCLCFNLKWGCIIIAILTMINVAVNAVALHYTSCGENGGAYKLTMEIAMYVMLAVNALACLAAIVFLFGIFKSIPETATLFMFAVALAVLINLAFVVMAIVFTILDSACSRYLSIIAPAVALVVWVYFIIVVNSYEEKMLD